MKRIDPTRVVVFAIAGMLLIVSSTAGVVAHSTTDDHAISAVVVETGDHDIVIRDVTVNIADAHIMGPGLPEKSVDHATYTVNDTVVSTDGFVVTIDGRDIEVGHLSISFENVGVTLENVSIGEPRGE